MIRNRTKKIIGWYGCNWEWKEYLEEIFQEIWDLWKTEEFTWVKELYFSESFIQLRDRYIEINKQLEREPVGNRRSKLVEEERKLKNQKRPKNKKIRPNTRLQATWPRLRRKTIKMSLLFPVKMITK